MSLVPTCVSESPWSMAVEDLLLTWSLFHLYEILDPAWWPSHFHLMKCNNCNINYIKLVLLRNVEQIAGASALF